MAHLIGQSLGVPLDQIDEEANLIELGVDSIGMMRLAGQLRRAGFAIGFAELIGTPTLAGWRRLIAAGAPGHGAVAPPGAAAEGDDAPFDLALMQHAYWVGRDPTVPLGGVAAHFYHEFEADRIDPVRLEAAVRALLSRHGMLRVRILDDGRQWIPSRTEWAGLTVHDLRDWTDDEARRRLEELRSDLSHRRMDLAAGEVFDVAMSLLPDSIRPGGARLHVSLDMIAADAMSLRLLLKDLACLYLGDAAGMAPLRYSYPRYLAARQAARAEPERAARLARDRAYWAERLPDLPGAPRLPLLPAAAETVPTVTRRHRWLAPEARAVLERRAATHGLTLALALAALVAEALTLYSADPDFLLNLPLFDRDPLDPEVESVVGDFTTSILLEWRGGVAGGFAERAARLQERFHRDVVHAGYSGVEVLRDATRRQGRVVLAPVVFTSALGLGDLFGAKVREAFGSAGWIISQGPQVWLDAQVTELDGGLLVNWDVRDSLFPPRVLDDMFDAFSQILDRLLADPAAWTRPVPALLPPAQSAARARANATDAPPPVARLHDGAFAWAARRPDAPAVLWGDDGVLSYRALAEAALRVAGWLRGSAGVDRGDLVALSLPKGPDQVVAALGILAAGAAYLPLNPDQPLLRRQRILASAGARLLLDDLAPTRTAAPLDAPVPGAREDLAYVLYTSGSTGEPKGVELTHLAAMNTLADLVRRFAIGAEDRTLALSALDFDLSVFDLFAPLSQGGAVVCVAEADRRDAAVWTELIRRHRVTVLNCVPALAEMLAAAAGTGLPALRLVLLGGDWVPLSLPGALTAIAPGCRVIALGGTTETAIHSTVQDTAERHDGWVSVPYGVPLTNVRCRVVDVLGRDRPDLVPGELWIGGTGVARGYRGDPARTADRFVIRDGRRWYRTGDLARYLPGGRLEFLGRIDHQVKVLGNRIELGEVEAALAANPALAAGIALVGEDGHLLAAVVAKARPAPTVEAVRAHLAERLPAAMIPARILRLDALPLSANGKVDRPALARLAGAPVTMAGAPPRAGTEARLAAHWEEILATGPIGRDADFFASGGDSLLATRLIARLRADGFAAVGLSEVFAHPVLADLARHLLPDQPGRVAAAGWREAPGQRHEPFPCTDVQRAYLVGRAPDHPLGGIGCHFYREFEADGLDVPRLERALNRLIDHHGMLRAVFDAEGTQRVLATTPPYRIEVSEAPAAEATALFARWREAAAHRVFAPGIWPLFSVTVARAGKRTRVGIGIDNLILDALSILLFCRDLDRLYRDPAAVLPPTVSFRDYLLNARDEPAAIEAAWAFWSARLDDLPPAPRLPLAVDPATVTAPRFVRRARRIGRAAWDRLQGEARRHGVTPSAVLLAAYGEVLGRWSAQPDLTLTLTLFDRRPLHPGIEETFGDFTSLSLVRVQPKAGDCWLDRLRRLQGEMWGALDHRAVSALRVLRALARRRGEAEVTMPVVFTSALGLTPSAGAERRRFDRPLWGLSQTPQVWLDHQVTEDEDGVCLIWDAVEALFPDGLLDTLFDAYGALLDALAGDDWTAPVAARLPAAQERVRATVNDSGAPAPARRLHDAVLARAARQPDRPALLWGEDGRLSYGELAGRALRLAAGLRAGGIGRGDLVAVTLPKGPDQAVAVLGVLAAGAAYVPIGIAQPPLRRARLCRQAGIRAVIGDAAGAAGIGDAAGAVVGIDLAAAIRDSAPLPEAVAGDPDDLAYVIFTSGSTGEPKGVEMPHRAAANTVDDLNARCGVGEADRVLAVSGLDFDLSVYDLFGPLSAGGAVVIPDEESRRDASAWLALMRRHHVTVWNSVPALLEMLLLAAGQAGAAGALRVVLVSGDWIGLDQPGRVAAAWPGCRFLALGGATEAAIWSNVHEVGRVDPAWRSIPYGTPLRGQRFRVVDPLGRDCPDLVPGELWIGGAGVARGYRGRPDLTAWSFPQGEDGRWYRTGDLGRYRPDGVIEFLGRADQQVKLGGHRVELGEVEAALRDCAGVGQAVAAITGGSGSPGPAATGMDRRLVAVVTPAEVSVPAVPVVTPEADSSRRERAETEAVEAAWVEAVLIRLLGLAALGPEATDLATRVGVAEETRPLLRLWLDWLERRGLVSARHGGHGAGPRLAERLASALPDATAGSTRAKADYALFAEVGHRLLEQEETYRAILAGRLAATALLDDPVLAPEALSLRDPAMETALAAIVDEVAGLARALGRPVELAEIGGRSGRAAAHLLDRLDPALVRYTLLDPAATMVAAAGRRLAGRPTAVACLPLSDGRVEPVGPHRFDLVIALNALHRFAAGEQGPALARLLLRRGGRMIVVERAAPTPLLLLTAAPLDGGRLPPLASGGVWAGRLAAVGLVDVVAAPVGGSPTEIVSARRPEDSPDLDPVALRSAVAERLPTAMVPERIEVRGWLPLTGNGKVDRAAVARLETARTAAPGEDEPPHPGLEQTVADLWREVLDLPSVGRGGRFFDLGGDSLRATRFLTRLRARTGLELPLRSLFAASSLAEVAMELARRQDVAAGTASASHPVEEGAL